MFFGTLHIPHSGAANLGRNEVDGQRARVFPSKGDFGLSVAHNEGDWPCCRSSRRR